ncbi:MAG: hypothetical protein EA379_11310, partial [Phycisphaerales bacterium]
APEARGAPTPHVVTAAGSVRAEREGSSLRAELVEALLESDDRGGLRISTLAADLGVAVRTATGGAGVIEARAQRLRARPLEEIVELSGEASIARDGGVVRGESMRLEGETGRLTVFGAGVAERLATNVDELMGYERVRVEWRDAMIFDDSDGVAECMGRVEAVADAANLSRDTARGERLLLTFSADPDATARGGDPQEAPRRLRRVELYGAQDGAAPATLEARRYIADDRAEAGIRLERMIYLSAPEVLADAASETVRVPSAGSLLIEDRSDRARSSSSAATAQGTTLFEWDGDLTLRRDNATALMRDRVRLRHRPRSGEEMIELESEAMSASFDADTERLTAADATGAVYARRGGRQLVADRLRYDADEGTAVAEAWAGNLVTLFDEVRPIPQTATSVSWDLIRDVVRMQGSGTIAAPR